MGNVYYLSKYHFNLSLSLVGSGSLSTSTPLFSQLDSLSRHSSSRLIAPYSVQCHVIVGGCMARKLASLISSLVLQYLQYISNKSQHNIIIIITLRACARGIRRSVCPSVIVVLSTKLAISHHLGICVCYKHNRSIDIGEKLIYTHFKLLKKAY